MQAPCVVSLMEDARGSLGAGAPALEATAAELHAMTTADATTRGICECGSLTSAANASSRASPGASLSNTIVSRCGSAEGGAGGSEGLEAPPTSALWLHRRPGSSGTVSRNSSRSSSSTGCVCLLGGDDETGGSARVGAEAEGDHDMCHLDSAAASTATEDSPTARRSVGPRRLPPPLPMLQSAHLSYSSPLTSTAAATAPTTTPPAGHRPRRPALRHSRSTGAMDTARLEYAAHAALDTLTPAHSRATAAPTATATAEEPRSVAGHRVDHLSPFRCTAHAAPAAPTLRHGRHRSASACPVLRAVATRRLLSRPAPATATAGCAGHLAVSTDRDAGAATLRWTPALVPPLRDGVAMVDHFCGSRTSADHTHGSGEAGGAASRPATLETAGARRRLLSTGDESPAGDDDDEPHPPRSPLSGRRAGEFTLLPLTRYHPFPPSRPGTHQPIAQGALADLPTCGGAEPIHWQARALFSQRHAPPERPPINGGRGTPLTLVKDISEASDARDCNGGGGGGGGADGGEWTTGGDSSFASSVSYDSSDSDGDSGAYVAKGLGRLSPERQLSIVAPHPPTPPPPPPPPPPPSSFSMHEASELLHQHVSRKMAQSRAMSCSYHHHYHHCQAAHTFAYAAATATVTTTTSTTTTTTTTAGEGWGEVEARWEGAVRGDDQEAASCGSAGAAVPRPRRPRFSCAIASENRDGGDGGLGSGSGDV